MSSISGSGVTRKALALRHRTIEAMKPDGLPYRVPTAPGWRSVWQQTALRPTTSPSASKGPRCAGSRSASSQTRAWKLRAIERTSCAEPRDPGAISSRRRSVPQPKAPGVSPLPASSRTMQARTARAPEDGQGDRKPSEASARVEARYARGRTQAARRARTL